MAETRRKLTTILSADVQGYTRLMGSDEEGTLATLKRYRESMRGLIGLHGGRVVNTWGDGLIAEFPSVVEAVRAAIDIQNELAEANSGKPAGDRMLFRIGINLGDVIETDGDLYGDGVNIAARLQAQAPAGGIVISSTVYDHVHNKLSVGFDFLGELAVKNVEEAIPSYSVRIGAAAQASPARQRQDDVPPAASRPPGWSPPAEIGRTIDGLAGQRGRVLAVIGMAAAIVLLVNIFTWDGEFWAAWPLLVFATVTALIWSRSQAGAVRRFAPAVIVSAALLGINLLSWSGTLWAQWPILGIAAVAALRWAAARSNSS